MSISRSRSSAILPNDIGNKTLTGNLIHPSSSPHTGLRQRLSSALFGSKGSMLIPGSPSADSYILSAKGKDQDFKQENPVARLKLLLVSFFYTTFAFGTVCSTGRLRARPSTKLYRHNGKQLYYFFSNSCLLTDRFLPGSSFPEPLHNSDARRIAYAL